MSKPEIHVCKQDRYFAISHYVYFLTLCACINFILYTNMPSEAQQQHIHNISQYPLI